MRVVGPHITKTIHIPARDAEVMDVDAYWQVDNYGDPDDEFGWYFAKVAFPTLADVKRHVEMERDARAMERQRAEEDARARRRQKRQERRAADAAYLASKQNEA